LERACEQSDFDPRLLESASSGKILTQSQKQSCSTNQEIPVVYV